MYYNHENPIQKSIIDNKILVVDDAAINREIISGFLKSAGYSNIEFAVDGLDAMAKLEDKDVDLMILDLLMPNMNGMDVIKTVRANDELKQLPILVQTAISDPEERADAWMYGATDIITKPINKLELLARVKVHLENSYLLKELGNYQKTADQEVSKALELQKSLLPSGDLIASLEDKYGICINSIYIPSRFLSGDIWGLCELDEGRIMVWICDFSGKGIGASLYTQRLYTLINENKNRLKDPVTLIHFINQRVVEMVRIGHFCTFLVGVIDLNRMQFDYLSASAPHPIIYHSNEESFDLGDGTGIPLGISKDASYEMRTMSIKPSDSIVLYSDLMWEEEGNIPNMSFLPDDLPELVRNMEGASMIGFAKKKILESGETAFSDDLTLIEISLKQRTEIVYG